MSVYLKLQQVQIKLKAPKSQFNAFGKYNYRNCEDILEAVKPLLQEVNATLIIHDELMLIGDRYYIKATAKFVDVETANVIEVTALAREEESKKGMDGSQVTGASSSYARKYALNGLFLIDDTKDSDTINKGENDENKKDKTQSQSSSKSLTDAQIKRAYAIASNAGVSNEDVKKWIMTAYNKTSLSDLTKLEYDKLCTALESKAKAS